ncbi:MAG: hypothetical protein ACI9OJ_000554 [Myxococcota bacterium]|jgi:hypothetical protein
MSISNVPFSAISLTVGLACLLTFGCSSGTTSVTPPVADATGGTGGDAATTGTDGTDGTSGTNGSDGTDSTTGLTGSDNAGKQTFEIPQGTDIVCEDPKAKDLQQDDGWPFTGVDATPNEGQTYGFTCTMCPGGTNNVNGKYRFFLNDRLDEPDASVYRETMEMQGNAFINVRWYDNPESGKVERLIAKGYYFCPEPGALSDINFTDWWNTVWVYTSVESDGSYFNLPVGHAEPCFLGVALGGGSAANDALLDCNSDWDKKGGSDTGGQLCRIGSTILGQDCVDPFDTKFEL